MTKNSTHFHKNLAIASENPHEIPTMVPIIYWRFAISYPNSSNLNKQQKHNKVKMLVQEENKKKETKYRIYDDHDVASAQNAMMEV